MSESEDLHRLLGKIETVEPRAIPCTPGTRIRILDEVIAKAKDPDGPNIILIRGAPGSGKSSLSLSATSRLRDEDLLATYFRFDRNQPTTTTPATLWRLVTSELARRVPSLRTSVLQQLGKNKVDLKSAEDVFTSLVWDPLSNLTDNPPFVIVIDALDECGGLNGHMSSDRQALLQTLRQWSQLPKHFKLLVTSREEGDVHRALSSISTSINVPSGSVIADNQNAQASIDASNDILSFLIDRLRRVRERTPSLPADWPGAETFNLMVNRAAGNFLWATIAADFIDKGIDPQQRLDEIMSHTPESRMMSHLDSLYTDVLNMAFGDFAGNSSKEAAALRIVLSTMVLARRPFHDEEYTKLPTPVTIIMLENIRNGLRSVITPDAHLCFMHKTFDDFLLSEECPTKYRIQVEEFQQILAGFCLSTMNKELRFNLCNLETSYLRNGDMPSIENKVTGGISRLLSYSCYFWADHLSLSPPNDEWLMREVRTAVLDKLLYWFEAMSLLKEVNRISPSLLLLLKWSHTSPNEEFKDFVHDARRFIGAFGQPITQSAPHIYISALAFAPEYSLVASHFRSQFPRILTLSEGRPTNWSSCLFTSEYHQDWVNSVAFSADEKRFVSGSADGTICICDSETGNLIAGPFRVASPISSVFFDPDGRCVWANCHLGKMFRLNVETGDKALAFQAGSLANPSFSCCFGGGQSIMCASRKRGTVTLRNAEGEQLRNVSIGGDRANIVSYSPTQGYYIACLGSNDTTLRIWKLGNKSQPEATPNAEPELKHDEPISALSFSSDGSSAVSGSVDGTILIWDPSTGHTVGSRLDTKDAEIDAVAYSSTRSLIVSASGCPGIVKVWNASMNGVNPGVLDGHTSWITKIVLSGDGRRALTASKDKTVRMWDLVGRGDTGVAPTNQGHMFKVEYVAFSTCGGKLVSVDRKEIRIWDANTGKSLLRPISSVSFNQTIFSPDGSYIVACDTEDGIIRVWNANTRKLAFHQKLRDDDKAHTTIDHLSFRSTDQQLVVVSNNAIVRVWSLEDGSKPEYLSSSPQPTNSSKSIRILALSPDGLTVIVRDDNRKPRHYAWSTVTCQPLPLTLSDDENISGGPMTYSPSGRYFAATNCGLKYSTVRVWDTQTGQLVVGPSTLVGRVRLLAFSPNDRHIAFSSTSDNTAIWIWDVHTNSLVSGPWKGHTGDITALSFSPSGEHMVSGSDDGWIRIWGASDLRGDSQNQFGFSDVGTQMQDGWVMDADGKLLFWVPSDHRAGLVLPRTLAVMGGSGSRTKLNFSKFEHGIKWTGCFGKENGG